MNPELIDNLVADLKPVRPRRRFGILPAAIGGLVVALVATWLVFGNRYSDHASVGSWLAWGKLIPFVVGAAGFAMLAHDAAVPGRRPRRFAVSLVIAAVAAAVGFVVTGLYFGGLASVLQSAALRCVSSIPLLAIPVMALLAWRLRSGAVTNPALAGLIVGATGGAAGAIAYGTSCRADDLAFVGIWYLVGISLATMIGYFCARSWFRW